MLIKSAIEGIVVVGALGGAFYMTFLGEVSQATTLFGVLISYIFGKNYGYKTGEIDTLMRLYDEDASE